MNVLICGGGIAGLTLALCLERSGVEFTVVEKAQSVRDQGYMIDFFSSGYDAAEKLGLLPDLERIHYPISSLSFVDEQGREKFAIGYPTWRKLFNGRHFNFLHGDLEKVLYSKVSPGRVRFGTTVQGYAHSSDGINVQLSDGTSGSYDLLVGADGIHSKVRDLAFGSEEKYTRFLGLRAAAYIIDNPPKELTFGDAFVSFTLPGKQAAVYPIEGNRLATFFVYASSNRVSDRSPRGLYNELSAACFDMGWIVPDLLERCDPEQLYLDDVSQVVMSGWSAGRIGLVGDACQCVSLVAGEGASLAVTGAFILSKELSQTPGDTASALGRYESRMRSAVQKKQIAGRRIIHWFVPSNSFELALRDSFTRLIAWPPLLGMFRRMLTPQQIVLR